RLVAQSPAFAGVPNQLALLARAGLAAESDSVLPGTLPQVRVGDGDPFAEHRGREHDPAQLLARGQIERTHVRLADPAGALVQCPARDLEPLCESVPIMAKRFKDLYAQALGRLLR